MVLNMSRFWIYFLRNTRKFRFLKYEDFFGVSVSRKLMAFLRKYKKLFQRRLSRESFGGLRLESAGFHFRKYKKSLLLRKYKKFFRGFCFLKCKEFFSGFLLPEILLTLELRSSISWNIRNFFRGGFFYFLSLGQKVQGFVYGNIRKAFFWQNIINFFSVIFLGKNVRNLFREKFWGLTWEVRYVSLLYNTSSPLSLQRSLILQSQYVLLETHVILKIFHTTQFLCLFSVTMKNKTRVILLVLDNLTFARVTSYQSNYSIQGWEVSFLPAPITWNSNICYCIFKVKLLCSLVGVNS